MTKKANHDESKMTAAELSAKAEEMKSQLSAIRKAARLAAKEEEAERLRLERERADAEALELGRKLRNLRIGRYTMAELASFDDDKQQQFAQKIALALDMHDAAKGVTLDGRNVYAVLTDVVNRMREQRRQAEAQKAAENADAQKQG